MKAIGFTIIVMLLVLIAALWLWRQFDHQADTAEAERLRQWQPVAPARFTPDLIAHLPEPARRYFHYVILPDTPLYTVADIEMRGQFGMGGPANPSYIDIHAWQTLAPPQGFVWSVTTERGQPRLSGSDSGTWTRMWLWDVLPVARQGRNDDHALASFGRYIAEAVFWSPASLLPGPGITWEAIDADTARVTVTKQGMTQAVDIHVRADGQPDVVVFQRWSDANPQKRFQRQPFGGYLHDFQEFQGFRLPTRIEAGNHFGTPDYFPFFKVQVTGVTFRHK